MGCSWGWNRNKRQDLCALRYGLWYQDARTGRLEIRELWSSVDFFSIFLSWIFIKYLFLLVYKLSFLLLLQLWFASSPSSPLLPWGSRSCSLQTPLIRLPSSPQVGDPTAQLPPPEPCPQSGQVPTLPAPPALLPQALLPARWHARKTNPFSPHHHLQGKFGVFGKLWRSGEFWAVTFVYLCAGKLWFLYSGGLDLSKVCV